MPKGRHKGKHRTFTSPEQLEEERKREERERQWREQRGSGSEDGSESGSDSEDDAKAKGASNVIDIENPNRIVVKNKKVTELDTLTSDKPQLSRKEREEVEKQRAKAHYQKMHAEGKTEEARADLARLAIIKKQREESAKKRDEEKKAKEDALIAKREQQKKAFVKKKS